MDDVTQALVDARAIIADPGSFAQGAMARDAEGCPVSFRNPRATCFCSWGALQKVAPDAAYNDRFSTHDLALIRLGKAARTVLADARIPTAGGTFAVPVVNDLLGREAALRMYDLAIAEAA